MNSRKESQMRKLYLGLTLLVGVIGLANAEWPGTTMPPPPSSSNTPNPFGDLAGVFTTLPVDVTVHTAWACVVDKAHNADDATRTQLQILFPDDRGTMREFDSA